MFTSANNLQVLPDGTPLKTGDLIRFTSPLSGERIGVIVEFDTQGNLIAFTSGESVFDREDKTHWVHKDDVEVISEDR